MAFSSDLALPGRTVRVQQQRHAFWFGCNGYLLGEEQDPGFQRRYEDQLAGLFNVVTLPFYWSAYEAAAGLTAQRRLQSMARWCTERGIVAKGHPLLWTHPAGSPPWLPDDLDEVRTQWAARITELVRQFAGLIDCWDLLCEPTEAFRFDTALARQFQRDGLVACLRQAADLAREANPNALLLVDDYRVDQPAVDAMAGLVDEAGAPLYDAVGLLTHQLSRLLTPAELWTICERFAPLGRPLHSTSTVILSGRRLTTGPLGFADGGEPQFGPTNPGDEAEQAAAVEAYYTTLFSHPAVEAITWWDLSDRGAWLQAPAGLLRADGSPKPAYETLWRLIRHDWWTDATVTTDADGQASLRVFAGDHRVACEAAQTTVHAARGGAAAVVLRLG